MFDRYRDRFAQALMQRRMQMMPQHSEPDADERGGPRDGDVDDRGMMQRPPMQMPMQGMQRPPMQMQSMRPPMPMQGMQRPPMPMQQQPGGIVREDDPRFRGMYR